LFAAIQFSVLETFMELVNNFLKQGIENEKQISVIQFVALFSQACIMPQKTVALIKPFAVAKALGKLLP